MAELEREIATYNRLLPELLAHEGKFVVIHEEEQIGLYDTYPDALKAGYEKCGMEAFLVKRIAPAAQISYFSRDLSACPASL